MSDFITGNRYLEQNEMLNNAQLIGNYLIGKGWSKNAICGVLGNMQYESTMNPTLWESFQVGDTSVGFGLVQWTPASKIINWCTENGKDYNNPYDQLDRLIWEVTNGDQWIATTTYNISFSDFIKSNDSPYNLAMTFINNYERPLNPNQPERGKAAEYYFNQLSFEDKNQKIIDDACSWAVNIANDDTHGYDQENRWGVDYDCSSLIISAFRSAGLTINATYTGDMFSGFSACGFINVIDQVNTITGDGLIKGDIILASSHHTALSLGNGQVVSAHANEKGEATGGQTGDQTGHEIDVSNFYTFSDIDYVLRLPTGGTIVNPPVGNEGEVWEAIKNSSYNVNQLTEQEINYLKTLSFNDYVYMKHTFNRNKRFIGKNCFGNKLTFDNKRYIITNVTSKGFVTIKFSNESCSKIINPKYIKEGSV